MEWTEIEERLCGDVVIVDLSGRMTLSESPGRLFDKIIELLGRGRSKIVLNLVRVPHIDSQGLADIVYGYTTAARLGGSLKMCAVAQRMRDLLTVMKLSDVIETFDSEEDALKTFAASQP